MENFQQFIELENLIDEFEFQNIGDLKSIRLYILDLLEKKINLFSEVDLNYRRKFLISRILTAINDNIGRKTTFPLSICIYYFEEFQKPLKEGITRDDKINIATKESIKKDIHSLRLLSESDFLK